MIDALQIATPRDIKYCERNDGEGAKLKPTLIDAQRERVDNLRILQPNLCVKRKTFENGS